MVDDRSKQATLNSSGKDANEMAKAQKEIGVAEFFARNKHLLGFDNKRKALLTAVKEAVDNSLDACEEARILPEIIVELVDMGNERYRVIIEDNGPGIIKEQIPKVFAKLLYGSKFHKLAQSRGQQGIGISAAVMYGQLTTGRASKVISTTGVGKQAYYCELKIDTKTNKPDIIKEEHKDWPNKDHGTRIEIDLEGTYIKGSQSVDVYLKETSIVNPHATIIYTTPKAEHIIFPRVTEELPKAPVQIKPHPEGVEIGTMIQMLESAEERTLQAFLTSQFSRVGSNTAKEICENARLLPNTKPTTMNLQDVENLIEGIKKTKIIAPSAEAISPITAELLENGLRKEVKAEFYSSITRPAFVYKGNPFIIECALAYGGEQTECTLMRFANRVPLLYQQGGCATFKAAAGINWKAYGMQQQEGNLPVAPITILVHIASVWVPYTNESKEAIAHYPEIIKEIKLALQECGRKLGTYIHKKKRVAMERERVNIFERYIPEVSEALAELTKQNKKIIEDELNKMLEKNKEFIQSNTSTITTVEESESDDTGIRIIGKSKDEEEQDE